MNCGGHHCTGREAASSPSCCTCCLGPAVRLRAQHAVQLIGLTPHQPAGAHLQHLLPYQLQVLAALTPRGPSHQQSRQTLPAAQPAHLVSMQA